MIWPLGPRKRGIDNPYKIHPWRKKQGVWRLVKQLWTKRKLVPLRDKRGIVIRGAGKMAQEISTFWSNTMSNYV